MEKDLEKGASAELADSEPPTPVAASATETRGLEGEGMPGTSSPSRASTSPPDGGRDPERARRPSAGSHAPPAVAVPRRERRGLLAHLAVVPEVTEPTHHPRRTKWLITFIVALAAAAAPTGSAIILPSLAAIAGDFDATLTVTNLSIALYMLSMSIFPLWWSSFSETLGRRTIYLVSFALLILFGALGAVAGSIGMFVAMRVLGGGASASVQAVGAGTIADIWEVKERGKAMGVFYLGPLCGPFLAPIIGGGLAQGLGWRSTQWFLAAYGGVTWMGVLLCLPETLRRRPDVAVEPAEDADADAAGGGAASAARPRRQRVRLGTQRWLRVLHRCFVAPLKIILYLRYPPVLLTVSYASTVFCALYFLNISVSYSFSMAPYAFGTTAVGLLYLANSLGYIAASIFGGRWIDSIMEREARRADRYDEHGKLVFRPEDRMRENAWLGLACTVAGLIAYGWTVQKAVFWFAPMAANFLFGIGSMLIFAMAITMLTEFMPRRGSHGIALNNFVRNLFACLGSALGEPLIAAIGNGWLFTILGVLVAVVGVGVVVAMRWVSRRKREVPVIT